VTLAIYTVCIAVHCQSVFVMQIWPQVKAANPHLSSVTEIGAVVGAMWRDLDPVEKQRYNDQFNKEKVTLRNFVTRYCLFSCIIRPWSRPLMLVFTRYSVMGRSDL